MWYTLIRKKYWIIEKGKLPVRVGHKTKGSFERISGQPVASNQHCLCAYSPNKGE